MVKTEKVITIDISIEREDDEFRYILDVTTHHIFISDLELLGLHDIVTKELSNRTSYFISQGLKEK